MLQQQLRVRTATPRAAPRTAWLPRACAGGVKCGAAPQVCV
jgi:hypothetical protein